MDRHRPFSSLWKKIVIQTTAEDFLRWLTSGSVTTNKFLRVLRNFALDYGWLPHPLIPTQQWPAVKYGKKRAITAEEHALIIAREPSPERKAYYGLAWLTGTGPPSKASSTTLLSILTRRRQIPSGSARRLKPSTTTGNHHRRSHLYEIPPSFWR